MGLFDFFKKKEPGVTPPPVPSAHLTQQAPSPAPVEEKKPKLLKDFFKMDIVNLVSSDDETIALSVDAMELGCFHSIKIETLKDGSHNIEMTSLSKLFTPEMYKFVASCTSTFGPTNSGEGNLTTKDVILLSKGAFSRMWKSLWLDMGRDEETGLMVLRLTIFNVEKNAFIEMV
jgi:hypothetical protein